ncbi:MAG: hypothetical protein K9M54_00840 [Kiritimatiellales bacterium]|nr:hypothetical protein [Kiritimatiellales bacterium]MCF7863242.1 hypothetical protein [Kiritimatiellales bacterium]
MNKMSKFFIAVSLMMVAVNGQATVVAWNNDFSGAINANFTTFTAGAGALVSQSGDQMVLNTGGATGARQGAVNTLTDETGTLTQFNSAPLYNFYDHQVKVRFDIASMTGTPGAGRNVFYFTVGNDSAGNYMPSTSLLDNGVSISLEQVSTGWRLTSLSYSNATYIAGTGGVIANISGAPTALVYTLDGTQVAISLEGAAISSIGSAGSGTVGGTALTSSVADISANISDYHLAFGAYNYGAVTAGTVVTLDSFIAEAIPEPSTLGLLVVVSSVAILGFRNNICM